MKFRATGCASALLERMVMTSTGLNRREFLLSASLLSITPLLVGQEDEDFSKVQIKVTPVSGSVYLLQGEGGNIAASVRVGGSRRHYRCIGRCRWDRRGGRRVRPVGDPIDTYRCSDIAAFTLQQIDA